MSTRTPAPTAVNFRVSTQANAYRAGAMDAYDLLVANLLDSGINGLLEAIEANALPETVERMNAYYAAKNGFVK
jgi:hypothetical protein